MDYGEGSVELREVQTLEGHGDRVWGLAWHPSDPSLLASCSGDKTVRIWRRDLASKEPDSWQCKAVLEETHTRTVRSCAWSPSGKQLAVASFDGSTSIWELVGGDFEFIATLEGHDNEVKSVSWSSSGSFLATCGRDKSVWIWAVPTDDNEFTCIEVLQGHTQDVKMVQWHPFMDILVSVSYDNSIKVWADDGDDDWHCVQTLDESCSGHASTVWALSFNSTGDKLVTCSDDLSLRVWSTKDDPTQTSGDGFKPWRHLCTLFGYHDRTVFSVNWSRDGVIASGAADDAIRIFVRSNSTTEDFPSYRLLLKKEKAHNMDVNCVQWNPKETRLLASASDDGTIKIWDMVVS